MIWEILVVVAVVAWAYMSAVCIRWDRYSCSLTPDDTHRPDHTHYPDLCVIFWWLAMPALWKTRPPHPWRIMDPLPSPAERLRVAEALSLEREREAGLEFDGIFLKEGYASPPSCAVVEGGYISDEWYAERDQA